LFAGGRARAALVLRDLRAIQDLPTPHARSMGIEDGRGEVLATATLSPEKDLAADVQAKIEGARGVWGPLRWRGAAAIGATVHGRGLRSAHIDGRVAARHLSTCNDHGRCSIAPSADVSGEISLSPDRPTMVRLNVQASDFAADAGNTTIAATSLTGSAELSGAGWSATARLTDLSAGAPARNPTIRSHSAELTGRFPNRAASPAVTELRAKLVGTSFNWGSFTLHSAETQIESTWNGRQLSSRLGASTLRMEADGGAPRGWHANVRGASLRTNLRLVGEKVEGPVHLDLDHLVGRVGQTGIQGDLFADFSLGSSDPLYQSTDFNGAVRLRNVAVQAQRGEVHDWWADLAIQVGHLNTRENLDMAGHLEADFRDAVPILQVLASQDRIPQWVPRFFTLPAAHLDLAFERYCRRTDVQVLLARGGQLEGRARLLVGPGKVRGALHVRDRLLRVLSVGFNFLEEDSQVAPFAGTGWYGRQLVPLDEIVRGWRTPCSD